MTGRDELAGWPRGQRNVTGLITQTGRDETPAKLLLNGLCSERAVIDQTVDELHMYTAKRKFQ